MNKPFSRIAGIMLMAQSLMSSGMDRGAALLKSGAGDYKSRGKGQRSIPSKSYFRRGRGKHYDGHAELRMHNRQIRQGLHTAIVNGFPILQTRKQKTA